METVLDVSGFLDERVIFSPDVPQRLERVHDVGTRVGDAEVKLWELLRDSERMYARTDAWSAKYGDRLGRIDHIDLDGKVELLAIYAERQRIEARSAAMRVEIESARAKYDQVRKEEEMHRTT